MKLFYTKKQINEKLELLEERFDRKYQNISEMFYRIASEKVDLEFELEKIKEKAKKIESKKRKRQSEKDFIKQLNESINIIERHK